MTLRYINWAPDPTTNSANIKSRTSRPKFPLWTAQKGKLYLSSSLGSGENSRPYRHRPAKMCNTWNQLSYRRGYQMSARIAMVYPGQPRGSACLTSASRFTLACSRLRAHPNFPSRHCFRPSTLRLPVSATCNRRSARSAGKAARDAFTWHSFGVLFLTNVGTLHCSSVQHIQTLRQTDESCLQLCYLPTGEWPKMLSVPNLEML